MVFSLLLKQRGLCAIGGRGAERMKLRLVMLGKTRQPEIRALLEEYVHRIGRYAEIEVVELRSAAQLAKRRSKATAGRKLEPAAGTYWVLLDAEGRRFTSREFARWLAGLRELGTRELVFLCGDAGGFPESLRPLAHSRLSLSTLTLPHELARVVLAEQLYRAFAILAGHPYPR